MTHEEALRAILDGKPLQFKNRNGEWRDVTNDPKGWTIANLIDWEFRIKPVPREVVLWRRDGCSWFEASTGSSLNYVKDPKNKYESMTVREVLED